MKAFVVVSGGVVQEVASHNWTPVEHEVIDWDNLRDDPKFEWERLSEDARRFVQLCDPNGYKDIQEWIAMYESISTPEVQS